jgi:hypothetical protein
MCRCAAVGDWGRRAPVNDRELLAVLAGWLRNQPPGMPEHLPWHALLALAQQHGVLPLLHRAARGSCWLRLPEEAQRALLRASRLGLANAVVSEQHLAATLDLLAGHAIQPLLLKGAALAQTHYADSSLRPRCDADLLIPAAARARAHEVLLAAGYQRLNAVSGEHISQQSTYLKEDPPGCLHAYDIHWRVSNRHLFAGVQSYDELAERSIPVPALGGHARALAPADALVLACVHRLAHHADELRLIWLYDIHLLVQGLEEREFAEFANCARARQILRVCRDGLGEAQRWFGTQHPSLDAWLAAPLADAEASARVLSQRGQLSWLRAEMGSLPTLQARVQLLREHLLPPADYMLRRFDTRKRWLLPALYGWRILRGLSKLGRRRRRP